MCDGVCGNVDCTDICHVGGDIARADVEKIFVVGYDVTLAHVYDVCGDVACADVENVNDVDYDAGCEFPRTTVMRATKTLSIATMSTILRVKTELTTYTYMTTSPFATYTWTAMCTTLSRTAETTSSTTIMKKMKIEIMYKTSNALVSAPLAVKSNTIKTL